MSTAATDAWIDAIPDDVYKLCPCGCGKKWTYAKQAEVVHEHEQRFVEKFDLAVVLKSEGEK